MLGIGRITSQKDSGEIQNVQYQTPLEVASSPRMADFGFSSGFQQVQMLLLPLLVVIALAQL